MDIFVHKGVSFSLTTEPDDDADAPWDREDGHGPVRYARNKAAGDLFLHHGWRADRFYGYAEACRLALKDGWGYGGKGVAEWQATGLTKRQIAANAARADFERMRAWCNDEWYYCGVIVTMLDGNDEPMGTEFSASLWGIESDSDDYIKEVGAELADDFLANLKGRAS